MEGLTLYLLKSAVCSAILLGIYVCFFKSQTFFRFNRYFLITGMIFSLFLPLYTYTHEVTLIVTDSGKAGAVQTANLYTRGLWFDIFIAGYGFGIAFLVCRYLLGLIKIKTLIKQVGYISFREYRLVNTEDFKSSFSVFNYVFMDTSADLSQTEKELILQHELAHVRQYHWADLLLAQLFCILQWFNPLAWIYMKAIRENHEYLADRAVLRQGTSAAVYRAILVNHCIGTRVFSFSSSFFQYGMPRIKMLSRPSSRWINKTAVALILPAMGLFYWSFSETLVTIKILPAKKFVNTPMSVPISEDLEPPVANVFAPVKRVSKRVKKTADLAASTAPPLYLLDGIEVPPNIHNIDQNIIAAIHVLKDHDAIKEYGERGRNGVVLIYTKAQVK